MSWMNHCESCIFKTSKIFIVLSFERNTDPIFTLYRMLYIIFHTFVVGVFFLLFMRLNVNLLTAYAGKFIARPGNSCLVHTHNRPHSSEICFENRVRFGNLYEVVVVYSWIHRVLCWCLRHCRWLWKRHAPYTCIWRTPGIFSILPGNLR